MFMSVFFFLQWLCVPFVLMNPHSADITKTAFNFTYQAPWIGSFDKERAGRWIDNFLLLVRTTFSNFLVSCFSFNPTLHNWILKYTLAWSSLSWNHLHLLIWKVSIHCYWVIKTNSRFWSHNGHKKRMRHTSKYRMSGVFLVFYKALGNLGYQDFHQRTLSASSSTTARLTCFIAAPLFIILGLPSVLIGAAAASTGAATALSRKE